MATLVAVDQATKLLALSHLDPDPKALSAVRIVRGVYLKISTNEGGVWGILSGVGPLFFIILSAAVAVWLSILLLRLREEDRPYTPALILLLGGFIGNGIDRVRFGHAVDFLYMTWYSKGLMNTFNVADLAILTGLVWALGLWAVRSFRSKSQKATGVH